MKMMTKRSFEAINAALNVLGIETALDDDRIMFGVETNSAKDLLMDISNLYEMLHYFSTELTVSVLGENESDIWAAQQWRKFCIGIIEGHHSSIMEMIAEGELSAKPDVKKEK